jgi:hypothetical protein
MSLQDNKTRLEIALELEIDALRSIELKQILNVESRLTRQISSPKRKLSIEQLRVKAEHTKNNIRQRTQQKIIIQQRRAASQLLKIESKLIQLNTKRPKLTA